MTKSSQPDTTNYYRCLKCAEEFEGPLTREVLNDLGQVILIGTSLTCPNCESLYYKWLNYSEAEIERRRKAQ